MAEIFYCDQGSEEWFKNRLGSIGSSSISSVMAKARKEGSGMRVNLLYRLAGEILSGQSYEGYKNHHMDRGHQLESEGLALYELRTDIAIEKIGLIKDSPHKHASPDSITIPNPDNGFILGVQEVKSPIASIHIQTIIQDRVPPEYVSQCQWEMHICQADWCDFISYSPLVVDRPIWIKRLHRDEKKIKEMNEGADKFIAEMLKIVEKIRN